MVLIRILWLIAVLSAEGILAYIIAWIVIPEEGEQKGEAVVFHGEGTPAEKPLEWKRRRNAGLLLIGLGVIFLARQITGPFFTISGPC